ncbi:MAG: phosphotransferase [Acidobacteria bacterium]|nr:phosphotransferase [Acidobacteriota bacterium]
MPKRNGLALPTGFVRNVESLTGEAGRQWLDDLPQLIATLQDRWSIRIGSPFQNISFNFVAPVDLSDGQKAVLKIAPPTGETEIFSEARYLRTLGGNGVVKLLAECRQDRALLIERAVPGRTLAKACRDRPLDAVDVAIELLGKIAMPAPEGNVDVIDLDDWFENLERARGTLFPADYVDRALDAYSRLGKSAAKRYLHGDVHLENIICSGDEFVLIDPKGIVGVDGYEVAVFLNNFRWWLGDRPDLHELLTEALTRFSAALDIREEEFRVWAYAQMVLCAWWIFDEMPEQYANEVVQSDVWAV